MSERMAKRFPQVDIYQHLPSTLNPLHLIQQLHFVLYNAQPFYS